MDGYSIKYWQFDFLPYMDDSFIQISEIDYEMGSSCQFLENVL